MLRRFTIFLSSVFLLFSLVSGAGAMVYTYVPKPADLWDLDHNYYYTWGIDASDFAGQEILSASLYFEDIRNWDNKPNWLWVHLLDDAAIGVTRGYDGQGYGDAYFGRGVLLNVWSMNTTPRDITYMFDANELGFLSGYASDGVVALGFDPDCHFYNNGVRFSVETASVPEPATMLLFGTGLVLVGICGKKKIKM
jgi:hypothetical protein